MAILQSTAAADEGGSMAGLQLFTGFGFAFFDELYGLICHNSDQSQF